MPSCGQLLAHLCTECTAFSCPQLRTTVKCWPKNPSPAKPLLRPHLLTQNPISDLPLPSSGLAPPNQPCSWHPAPPALLATARSSPSAAATPTLCRASLEQGPTYGAGKPKANATDVLSVSFKEVSVGFMAMRVNQQEARISMEGNREACGFILDWMKSSGRNFLGMVSLEWKD